MEGGVRRGDAKETSFQDGVTHRHLPSLIPAGSMTKPLEMASQSQIPSIPHRDTELGIPAISQTVKSYPAPTGCLA